MLTSIKATPKQLLKLSSWQSQTTLRLSWKKVLLIKKVCNSLIIKVVSSKFKFHYRNFIEIHFPFHCFKSVLCAFDFVEIFHFVEILSKNELNLKPSNLKTIEI